MTGPRDGAGRPPGDPPLSPLGELLVLGELLAAFGTLDEPARPVQDQPSITCPRCGRTSHHPVDIAEGYCGACHDWTSAPLCRDCGRQLAPGVAEEAAQWRTIGDGRYFCRASADALHHPAEQGGQHG
jgi:hypothetical protein